VYVRHEVGFRPIDESDLEALRLLHNDMTTLLQLGTLELVSQVEQVEWWRGLGKNRTTRFFTLVAVPSGEVIGMLRVQHIDTVNGHCEIGLDILPAHRGRGLGTASYEMVLEFLFQHYNMHMVYLRVAEFNEQARRLYGRLGFLETGRYEEYLYRHGRYWDYIVMAMTHDRFRQRREGQSNS
jgi:RimJ/RimL family protein N-acetyltransferase